LSVVGLSVVELSSVVVVEVYFQVERLVEVLVELLVYLMEQ
jgi:hypothetical protein